MSKSQQKQKLTQSEPKHFKFLNYQIQNASVEKVGQMEDVDDNKNKSKYSEITSNISRLTASVKRQGCWGS